MSRYIKSPIKGCMNPQLQPLTPIESYCLLVLAGSRARAYEISQVVQYDVDGHMRISPAAAMHALKRMEKLGWVEQTNPRSSSNREGRIYELTHNGAVQLDMELDRMSAVVEKGRYKLRTHRQTMLPFDPDVMIGI